MGSTAGIRVFPNYGGALAGEIAPLEVELRQPYDIWLSHPADAGIPWVRDLLTWLAETLDPGKFPGLRGELTHPGEFKAVYKSESLT